MKKVSRIVVRLKARIVTFLLLHNISGYVWKWEQMRHKKHFWKTNLEEYFISMRYSCKLTKLIEPNITKNGTFYSEFVTLHCTPSVSLIATSYTVREIDLNCRHGRFYRWTAAIFCVITLPSMPIRSIDPFQ